MKILATSDWHLHSAKPICRIDENWVDTQKKCLDLLAEYINTHEIDILAISGDVFDTPSVIPSVSNIFYDFVNKIDVPIYMIGGNHDLPYHQYKYVDGCSYYGAYLFASKSNNQAANNINIDCFDFSEELLEDNTLKDERDVALIHYFSVKNENDRVPRDTKCLTSGDILKTLEKTRITIIGDNHQAWYVRKGDRLVVNCGTLLKRNATEANYDTGFYVVDTETLDVEKVSLFDFEKDYIDTSYLSIKKHLEETEGINYDSLVNELSETNNNGEQFDFIYTLEKYISSDNKVNKDIKNYLNKVLDHVKGVLS